MKLYIHMLLSGSICTLLYITFNHVFLYELPLKYRQNFIRINILFYLLPIPWAAAVLKSGIQWMFEEFGILYPKAEAANVTDVTSVWNSVFIVNEKGKILYITGYQQLLWGVIISSVLFLVIVSGWWLLYWRVCRQYKRKVNYIDAAKYMKNIKFKRKKVRIGFSAEADSPITIGIIRPIIFFPVCNEQYENSIEEIICHELEHIKRMDIVSRFLTFIVIATEWFNPLVYYLFNENIVVSEMLCDEEAIKGKTKIEKANYIRCIIEAVQETEGFKTGVVSLGMQKKLVKKRIERIMGKNQKNIWKKSFAFMIMGVCFTVSSIPAFAYQNPVEWTMSSQTDVEDWSDTDIVVFAEEGEWENSQIDFSQSDIIFISDEGESSCDFSLDLRVDEGKQMERICSHSYKSGTVSQHIKGVDNSCVVVVYNAQQCVKCGNILYGSEISRITYQPCIH